PMVSQVVAKVLDERNDTIDYTTGDPTHHHTGAAIDLSGSSCPDVYMYAYLMDQNPPKYGGEASPNPLAWSMQASSPAGIDETASAYRVRGDDGSTMLDWTAMSPGGGGAYSFALHRNGAPGIAQLGTRDGGIYVDARFHDMLGHETIATWCVKYHPLAAPVEIQPFAEDTGGGDDDLFGMSLVADSPISRVLAAQTTVPQAVSQRFVQHTAEPVTIDATITPPGGTFDLDIANWFVKTASGSMPCGTSLSYSTDQRCSLTTEIDSSYDWPVSGALGTAGAPTWSAVVVDEQSGGYDVACSGSGMHVTCPIPARQSGQPPHAYRIVTELTDVRDLWPASAGPFDEYTALSRTYTGLAPITISHCDNRTQTVNGQVYYYTCAYSTYVHIDAILSASIVFDPFQVKYQSTIGGTVPLRALPYEPATISSPSFTWDAGTDVLPGQ
ncbi:MAG TPA: hypothetical protein VLX92_27730, partial [Kofleriaceae bacterium]|nr:hypothetical protein [Kofleriaceae bacterium]